MADYKEMLSSSVSDPIENLIKNSKSTLKPGDKILLKFKLPSFNSDEFGKVENLAGEIPLLLNHGKLKPNLFYSLTPDKKDQLVNKYAKFAKTQTDDLDDEQIIQQVFFAIGVLTTYFPDMAPFTDEFDRQVAVNIVGFLCDDLVDPSAVEFLAERNITKDIQKTGLIFKQTQAGDIDSFRKIGLMYPSLQPSLDFVIEDLKNCENIDRVHYYLNALHDFCISHLLIFKKSTYSTLAPITKVTIMGVNKGIETIVERRAYSRNVVVSPNIRESFIFRELKDAANRISAITNDVKGLMKDIKNGNIRDSNILSYVEDEHVDLTVAFDKFMKMLQEDYRMVDKFTRILESAFDDNIGLQTYIQFLKEALDGQVYAYFGVNFKGLRYEEGGQAWLEKV